MEKGSHKPRFPVAEKLGLEEPLHCIRMEFAEGVIFGADGLQQHFHHPLLPFSPSTLLRVRPDFFLDTFISTKAGHRDVGELGKRLELLRLLDRHGVALQDEIRDGRKGQRGDREYSDDLGCVLDAHQVKEDVRESSGRDKDVFGLEELNTCLEAEFASPHYNVGPMKSSGGIDAGMEDSLAVLLFSAEDGRLVLDEVQVRLVSAKSIKDCALLVHNHGKLAGTVAEGGCSKVGVRVIQAEVGLGVRVGDGPLRLITSPSRKIDCEALWSIDWWSCRRAIRVLRHVNWWILGEQCF